MRLAFISVFLCFAFVVHSQSDSIQRKCETLDFVTLFDARPQDEISCYRIPAMVTAPNGDVIVTIDERVPSCADLRSNRDINIVLRRSTDNGRTWSDMETVVDYPMGRSASDPSMVVDARTGIIFLFFNYMDLDTEKDVYYFRVTQSTDNGKTCSTPRDITDQISKADWQTDFKFITAGRGIQTSDGTLLHTIVNLDKGLHVFGSDDHGEHWYVKDVPIKPADESKIVELADGSWMINSRVNDLGFRYVHTSTDEGKTWVSKPDKSLMDPGCNASIIRYSAIKDGDDKNRLLFSNANDKKDRTHLTLKISYYEGETWSEGKTIYLASAAYSSMTILKDGTIGIFFEKDEYQENVFVRLTLEWLTDAKDKYVNPKSKWRR